MEKLVLSQESLALSQLSDRLQDETVTVDEKTLLRFLRARDGDVTKAELMLRKYLRWRLENNLDDGKESEWTPPKEIVDDFRLKQIGLDKDGYPVVYCPLGQWNIRDRIEDGLLEEVNKFRIYLFENVLKRIQRESGKDRVVVIVDMAELNFHKVCHIPTISVNTKMFEEFESYYPEMLHAAYVINTPWMFPYAFSLYKRFLAAKTLDKIHIFNSNESNWRKAIQETIPLDIIPQEACR